MFWGYGHSLMQQVIYIERVNPSMGLLQCLFSLVAGLSFSQYIVSVALTEK